VNQQLVTAFFEDLARSMDHWVDAVAKTCRRRVETDPLTTEWG